MLSAQVLEVLGDLLGAFACKSCHINNPQNKQKKGKRGAEDRATHHVRLRVEHRAQVQCSRGVIQRAAHGRAQERVEVRNVQQPCRNGKEAKCTSLSHIFQLRTKQQGKVRQRTTSGCA